MMKKALPAPLDLPPSPACAGFGRAGLKERPTAQFSNMQINLNEKSVIAQRLEGSAVQYTHSCVSFTGGRGSSFRRLGGCVG